MKDCFIVFASGAKQSPGRVEVYGVYVPYFFGGIAAVAMLPRNDNEKRNCRVCGLQ